MKLSERLNAITEFIPQGANVADIGSDHGLVPVYLAVNNRADLIIASDSSADSLKAARRNAIKHNVENKIKFIVAPGLDGVEKNEVDTVVIAGLGGETIISILEDALWVKTSRITLVLQPQTKLEDLGRWLRENGFDIKCSKVVRDNKKLYTIFKVEWRDYE
jgi:tRNA (adenine22-N1)-methyltransferase